MRFASPKTALLYDSVSHLDAYNPAPMARVDKKLAEQRRGELAAFIEARNLKPSRWAKAAGVSDGTIRNFLNGISDTLTQATIDALANAERVDAADIFPSMTKPKPQGDAKPGDNNRREVVLNSSEAVPLPIGSVVTGADDLPILGHAKGGSDAYFIDNGEIAGYTMRPTNLKGVKDAYAVEIWDRSMEPALKHGHLAAVHPRKQPQNGDEVVIQLHDGQALVKELAGQNAKEWVFKQHNPAKKIKIGRDLVKAVHLIVYANRIRT